MFKRLKYWWVNNLPFITTKRRQDDFIIKCMKELDRVNKISTWSAINPVIYDLEKLRADTWNQDKITYIQNWLKDNFEIK